MVVGTFAGLALAGEDGARVGSVRIRGWEFVGRCGSGMGGGCAVE